MPAIKIKGDEYNLKYTIESWKKLSIQGITPTNIEQKMQEDFASVASDLVYYGLCLADREKITRDDLDSELDFSVMDVIGQAIVDSMPKQAKAQAQAQGDNVAVKKN